MNVHEIQQYRRFMLGLALSVLIGTLAVIITLCLIENLL